MEWCGFGHFGAFGEGKSDKYLPLGRFWVGFSNVVEGATNANRYQEGDNVKAKGRERVDWWEVTGAPEQIRIRFFTFSGSSPEQPDS